jgi:hypothetical protein
LEKVVELIKRAIVENQATPALLARTYLNTQAELAG